MGQPQRQFFIVAAEASGDAHAAHLVNELKQIDPCLKFSGLGGSCLRANGVELYYDMSALAVVGFIEVLKHYGEIRRVFQLIIKKIDEIRPQAVILVDYPGFNLRLAKEIKRRNIPVIYYISPQVWAWKENRVQHIKKYVDCMLVLFPFEKEFYARHGMAVEWVGHPLVDSVVAQVPKNKFLDQHGLKADKMTIALLPGSRYHEVCQLLPVMLRAADIIQKEFPQIQFYVLQAHTIEQSLLESFCRQARYPLKIVRGETYAGINACDLCVVASGTATLETAILGKPMVIVYKTSLLTWLLARLLVKIPYIGLVNVVAGEKIVPECIQFQATGSCIALELRKMITDKARMAQIKTQLQRIKGMLGRGGSSQRAAQIIYRTISPPMAASTLNQFKNTLHNPPGATV